MSLSLVLGIVKRQSMVAQVDDKTGDRVQLTLTSQLQPRGWEEEHVALCERKIGNYVGDFFCWAHTPGVCNVNDDNRAIANCSFPEANQCDTALANCELFAR